MNVLLPVSLLAAASLAGVREAPAHPDGFKPATDPERFYSATGRYARVTVTSRKLHVLSEHFLGINTSYFNDTDEIWREHAIPTTLKRAGVRALRYPGGEEASFFHWEHPGVNGYEDLWDEPEHHGYSRGRGPFQITWADPSAWATNEAFMSFDEFMAHGDAIGAEPVVGLNLSSGARHNREADGVEEALRWMRYCREKGYRVTYWFLDNEPWNFEAAHQMYVKPYAAECVRYGKAIKAEFPDVKLIANPFSSQTYNAWDEVDYFVRETGALIDYIDIHYYWEWGRSSFEKWRKTTPLETGDKWKHEGETRTYQQDFAMLREAFAKAGHDDMGLMVLEWNIGPSDNSLVFSQAADALVQGELLMEFMRGDVHIACLWPLLWRTRREVWAEQDRFPSIITPSPPYEETLTHDLFRLVAPLQGMQLVETQVTEKDLVVIGASQGNDIRMLLLNKNPRRRRVTLAWAAPLPGSTMTTEYIAIRDKAVMQRPAQQVDGKTVDLFVEPFSFNALSITRGTPR